MKILIITQKVDYDDPILGFFHNWLEQFSKRTQNIYVICLSKGKVNLPDNVNVLSLGKESGISKIGLFINLQKYLFKNLKIVDGIFYHMCPEYVIAAWPLVRLNKKKSILWFVHRSVNWKLKIANRLVNKIFTSSKQSCRIDSGKIDIVGHGINTEFFKPIIGISKKKEIICVGRITPIKDQLTLIRAAQLIYKNKPAFEYVFKIIGSPYIGSDRKYYNEVLDCIAKGGVGFKINVIPSASFLNMPKVYNQSSLLVNLCPTGGMDKVVLEAMACNLPVLVSNESFKTILEENNFFEHGNPGDLAEKILKILESPATETRPIILDKFSLDKIFSRIIDFFK